MSTIERWVLRTTDSDACWIGLGWLRPEKAQRVGMLRVLISSFILGLPGVVLGAGSIYLFLRRLDPGVVLFLLLIAMLVEVPLHLVWAHYWNRRVATLQRGGMEGTTVPS